MTPEERIRKIRWLSEYLTPSQVRGVVEAVTEAVVEADAAAFDRGVAVGRDYGKTKATLREREACAKVAEKCKNRECGKDIAAAIRNMK